MHADYYQNMLYPLQDTVLKIISPLPVGFYLTGGTALSRAYLHHRYSDDLDFFVNQSSTFKQDVELILKTLTNNHLPPKVAVADAGFVRMQIPGDDFALKIDFVDDVPFRSGIPVLTPLFKRTDTLENILSNKITALSRSEPKDVVDIVFISRHASFDWANIMANAVCKDMWVDPISVADILDTFPLHTLEDIAWIGPKPSPEWFQAQLASVIHDILKGIPNSLHSETGQKDPVSTPR
ncbi:MAG: nucleotidyl transferase AbiEii/AbiGii toxin family protein [Desulfoplanes sp.]|nr:nucleotidyl transferase AbiEii/AbiGii toxin family protein [Desulfoplanes sp.]